MQQVSDRSFGIIPLRKNGVSWEVLVIRHQAGHWAFPKGHPEKGESPMEAAERELFEETGLKVDTYLSQMALAETYTFQKGAISVSKSVEYFIAKVAGNVVLQEEELQDFKWLFFEEAFQQITYPESKSVCLRAKQVLC